MNKANTEEAREIFGADYYAAELTGVEILEADVGYAKCALKLEDKHRNALGQVMGGVLFTMADYAFAIASNFHQPPTVTQTSQIVYLSSVKGTTVYAQAEKIRAGKRTCFYKIVITISRTFSTSFTGTLKFNSSCTCMII